MEPLGISLYFIHINTIIIVVISVMIIVSSFSSMSPFNQCQHTSLSLSVYFSYFRCAGLYSYLVPSISICVVSSSCIPFS